MTSVPPIPSSVPQAISALESATSSFLSKQRKKRLKRHGGGLLPPDEERDLVQLERQANRAARHGGHVLRELTAKRRALHLAVGALGHCTDDCLEALRRNVVDGSSNKSGARQSGSSSAKHRTASLQRILTHWFTNYLRLRDGTVLLTSGECRHPADSEYASKTKFPSRFGTETSRRGDGYTSLYSSDTGYSGFGWDEFYNEDVGVQRRLVDACLGCAPGARPSATGRAKVWERLSELGVEAFENELDRHDADVKVVEGELEGVTKKFVDGVNRALEGLRRSLTDGTSGKGRGGRVVLTKTDKFERLELQNGSSFGISHLVIERRGDNFRVDDKGGVLPSDWNGKRWEDAFRLPKNSMGGSVAKTSKADTSHCTNKRSGEGDIDVADLARKKRRIIDDSSDEDDDDAKPMKNEDSSKNRNSLKQEVSVHASVNSKGNKTKGVSGGLTVKVKKAETNSPSTTTNGSDSLNAIKSKLGVDVESLERGLEDLEAQQRGAAATAVAEEATAAGINIGSASRAVQSPELSELMEDIAQGKEDVKNYERVLSRIGPSETEDLWDARELLRECKMTLGNLLLELHCQTSSGDTWSHGGSSPLKYAESLFRDSINLVAGQCADYEIATKNETQEKRNVIRRRLLLLRGRAETNLGISLIDQAEVLQSSQKSPHPVVGDGTESANATSILLKAIDSLKKAAEGARAMHAQASLALASGEEEDKFEASMDLFHARGLEALSTRRHGDALWYLGRRKDSMRKLEEASKPIGGRDEDTFPASESVATETLQANLDFLVEQYFAATSLVDHATTAAEQVPLVQRQTPDGDEMIAIACRGYLSAADISDKISQIAELPSSPSTFQEMHDGYDIGSKDDLVSAMKEMNSWWEERKSLKAQNSTKMHSRANAANLRQRHLPRTVSLRGPPTARIVVPNGTAPNRRHRGKHGESRRQAQPSKSTKSANSAANREDQFDAFVSVNLNDSNVIPTAKHQSRIVFRKWGDELLPQMAKAPFAYPACAPEMPQDMRQQ